MAVSDYAAVDQPALESPAPTSEHQSVTPGRRATRRRRRTRFGNVGEWMIVLLALLALVGAGGTLALILGERDYTNRIYPHISVRGLSLGTYRVTSARSALLRHYNAFLENPIALAYGDRVWRPSAEQLGLHLEIDAALQAAVALGRTGSRIDNVQTVAAIWEQGVEIPLHIQIDQAVIQRYLLDVANTVEAPPRNADVDLQGAEVVVTPNLAGVQVLVDETLQDITAALQTLEPQQITLRTRTLTPMVQNADIAPIARELHTLLDEPIVLTGSTAACPNCRWEWTPEHIARWVHLNRTYAADGRPMVSVEIDQAGIRSALVPIASALREEGSLPRVDWNNGQLQITQPGGPGRGLDAALALDTITTALRGGPRALDLPLIALPPPVTEWNLASLGITEPIGVGVSSFRASEGYRITNIQAGARRMHGLLVPPDGTFSFNDSLGPVDASGGFVEGLAIVNNRTQKEWGGGLCQVSTTMFRAAFWAGLPITERHEHSFRIGWYEELGEPPGFDAAIFTGAQDLRFVNDTGGWLLLQTGVDLNRQQLSIALYGAPTGRSVSISHQVLERTPQPGKPLYIDDPARPRGYFKQTDYARGGMTVEVYRVVRHGDSVLRQDTFPTTFKPWPNIYVRGTR